MGGHSPFTRTAAYKTLPLLVMLIAVWFAESSLISHAVAEELQDIGGQAEAGADYRPDVVFFKSAPQPPPSPFRLKTAKRRGVTLETPEPPTVLGRLFVPAGDAPFPGVVLLHGSKGIWDWNDVWAERLRQWGYVVLDVDSLTPRGLYRHNTGVGVTYNGRARRFVDHHTRSLDAHGARNYLADLPMVDHSRIAVLGMSQGGHAAMLAVEQNDNPNPSGTFQAAVALYPPCGRYESFDAPLLVLIGSADQLVDAGRCETNLATIAQRHELILKVYADAHHVFDFEAPERIDGPGLLRYDAEATADTIARIKAFLLKNLN